MNTLENLTAEQKKEYINYVQECMKKYNLSTTRAWKNFKVRLRKYSDQLQENKSCH